MSGQIIQSHRWSDKPVYVKQGIFLVLVALLSIVLCYRLRLQNKGKALVRAFTQATTSEAREKIAKEMAAAGVSLPRSQGQTRGVFAGARAGGADRSPTIQERPLFDGLLVGVEVSLDQPLSSESGDASAEVTITALLKGDGSSDISQDGTVGAKLIGTFQPNFDTERMGFQFHELIMADGRRYPVTGIALNPGDQSPGVPAQYSSGTTLRVLGATLGTVITTAQQIGTTRVLQNQTQQDGFAAQELNQAISQSSNQAGSSISDTATHGMKNTKAVLSLNAGTRFWVKLRANTGNGSGVNP